VNDELTSDLDALIEYLIERVCSNDGYYTGTVADLMLEFDDTLSLSDLVRRYGDDPVLGWTIHVSGDARCTHRGSGWGSYYGPEPDEWESTVSLRVEDDHGVSVYDESWVDYDGPDGSAMRSIEKHLAKRGAR
jgi:hypothetical protein